MREWVAIGIALGACSGTSGEADGPSGTRDAPLVFDAPLVVDAPSLVDAALVDAPLVVDASLARFTCFGLRQLAFGPIAALDKSCDDESDCEFVTPTNLFPTCDGMHIFSDAVVRKGWMNADLAALWAEYQARCERAEDCTGDNPCIADRSPPIIHCTAHTCTTTETGCPVPIDAPIQHIVPTESRGETRPSFTPGADRGRRSPSDGV